MNIKIEIAELNLCSKYTLLPVTSKALHIINHKKNFFQLLTSCLSSWSIKYFSLRHRLSFISKVDFHSCKYLNEIEYLKQNFKYC